MRETLVGKPVAGDVSLLPAVIDLHDLKTQRLEILSGNCGIGQDKILAHVHSMGVPAAPERDRTCRPRLSLARNRARVSIQRGGRISGAQAAIGTLDTLMS